MEFYSLGVKAVYYSDVLNKHNLKLSANASSYIYILI